MPVIVNSAPTVNAFISVALHVPLSIDTVIAYVPGATPVRLNVTIAVVPSGDTATFVPVTGGVASSVTVMPGLKPLPVSVTVTVAPTSPVFGATAVSVGGGSITSDAASVELFVFGSITSTPYVPGVTRFAGTTTVSASPVVSGKVMPASGTAVT